MKFWESFSNAKRWTKPWILKANAPFYVICRHLPPMLKYWLFSCIFWKKPFSTHFSNNSCSADFWPTEFWNFASFFVFPLVFQKNFFQIWFLFFDLVNLTFQCTKKAKKGVWKYLIYKVKKFKIKLKKNFLKNSLNNKEDVRFQNSVGQKSAEQELFEKCVEKGFFQKMHEKSQYFNMGGKWGK